MSWHELLDANRLAFDIEITGDQELLCVGFAASPERAYVFPAATRLAEIRELLASPVPKVAQNGQFDLHFLRTRCDIEVQNYADDTIVQWHACYPELAGAAQDKRGGTKRTRKGLAFLASLYTTDGWWKSYDVGEREIYELCGRDACITYEIAGILDREIDRLNVRSIYEHQMRLIEPCIAMQERGLRIDEDVRKDSLGQINTKLTRLSDSLVQELLPTFSARRDSIPRRGLFWKTHTCPCCRNGKNKRSRCWSCAGLSKPPGKRDTEQLELIGKPLGPCEPCGGRGQWEIFEFNANSEQQVKILLYDVFKLPKRVSKGKVTSDEEALKSLLALCS